MANAPVDLSRLARYTGGDKTLNAEILKLFDGQVSEMVCHTIKGAARGVGAFAMGEAAADAEPVDPITNPDRAIQVIEALRVEGEAVQAFIADYLAA